MKRLLLLLVSICCGEALFSTPITHLYFAKKWIEKNLTEVTEEGKRDFYLGALFPDMRYMNIQIDLSKVPLNPSKNDVIGAENLFYSGILFHNYINNIRNTLVEDTHILEDFFTLPQEERDLFLKIAEDQMFFSLINAKEVQQMVQEISPFERAQGLSIFTLKNWHRVISQYVTMTPESILKKLRQFNLGLFSASKETVSIWSRELPHIIVEPSLSNYIKSLDGAIEKAI